MSFYNFHVFSPEYNSFYFFFFFERKILKLMRICIYIQVFLKMCRGLCLCNNIFFPLSLSVLNVNLFIHVYVYKFEIKEQMVLSNYIRIYNVTIFEYRWGFTEVFADVILLLIFGFFPMKVYSLKLTHIAFKFLWQHDLVLDFLKKKNEHYLSTEWKFKISKVPLFYILIFGHKYCMLEFSQHSEDRILLCYKNFINLCWRKICDI